MENTEPNMITYSRDPPPLGVHVIAPDPPTSTPFLWQGPLAAEACRPGPGMLTAAGRIQEPMLASGVHDAESILDHAIERFDRFHGEPALSNSRDRGARAICVAPKLCLYYANRLVNYGLEEAIHPSSGSDA